MANGKIILVGAGPGDPELLTIKAINAIRAADVIMYDALVSPEIVQMAQHSAQLVAVGKKGHGPSCRQDDINRQMVEFARAGKNVVRLKGGDSLIFSRASEELDAARAANIPVQMIPGITAAQAAAAALCVPLTNRDSARRLQFVTGHDHKGALPEDISWAAISDPAATTVVYMAKKTLSALSEKVQSYGLPANTPAMAVVEASLPGQQIIRGTIGDLPARVAIINPEGPMVVLIGAILVE